MLNLTLFLFLRQNTGELYFIGNMQVPAVAGEVVNGHPLALYYLHLPGLGNLVSV